MNILLVEEHSENQKKFKGLLELAFPNSNIIETNIKKSYRFIHSNEFFWDVVLVLPIDSVYNRNELLQNCQEQKLQVMCIINNFSKEESILLLNKGVKALIGIDAPLDVLRNGINFVKEGGVYFDPKILKGIDLPAVLKDIQRVEIPDLTKRQWEIYRLIAKGYTTDEIATYLSLKPKTILNHMKKITEITKSKTLPGAIAKGFFHGWLRNI